MNQRYIDFVPAQNKTAKKTSSAAIKPKPKPSVRVVSRTKEVAASVKPREAMVARSAVSRGVKVGTAATKVRSSTVHSPASRLTATRSATPRSVAVKQRAPRAVPKNNTQKVSSTPRRVSTSKAPALGVVEDLNTHFVKTDVPKRPLSSQPSVSLASEAKKQKVKARMVRPVAKTGTRATATKPNSRIVEKPVENSTYKTPRPQFINQNKISKRPLSGNVYKKKASPVVKEEPKGPVTIIAKPEKDRHIGVIVTVIITIILGAAAGTIAFLLLPK